MAMQLYAGPKEYDTLKRLNVGLEDTIDFGWFVFGSWGLVKAVAKPIFYVLRFLYEFTHNYGITIILLTMLIKLMFVPLQYKSYKSMKQMQVIQPKVLALQTKFKDDRERLNKELIKLYKDHRVNPVGGCLPMVLQMPVFVALFNILYMTIDLRQAPFMLWIQRPVRAGSLLRAPDRHGRHHGHSAEDHSDYDGSDAGEDHAVSAGVHDVPVREFSRRISPLLADEQYADDHPAGGDRAAVRKEVAGGAGADADAASGDDAKEQKSNGKRRTSPSE
jgi:YidC/Oxa1 family membrane protein insertase